ncbi:hypothetical protein PCASD_08117 [Puccinia coronata f. sp. avenae]|uniref:Uncharacterized protein n=1 Tax=Puccinia coronata f. sp. avenae TaxID=200324 RepID=A0A2N5VAB2_9BASI|nr:hypothetical protein PCASD_08117 [Puccinia coronata f. sp. avenae]
MKITGFTIIAVLFSVLASSTAAIIKIEPKEWTIRHYPLSDGPYLWVFKGFDNDQKEGFFSNTKDALSLSCVNREEIHLHNGSDQVQSYALLHLYQDNRWFHNTIGSKDTHIIKETANQFAVYMKVLVETPSSLA